MSHPQHTIRGYAETTERAAQTAAAHYSEVVDHVSTTATAGIQTGDWTGYAAAFNRLQESAWEALERRRHANTTAQLFGRR